MNPQCTGFHHRNSGPRPTGNHPPGHTSQFHCRGCCHCTPAPGQTCSRSGGHRSQPRCKRRHRHNPAPILHCTHHQSKYQELCTRHHRCRQRYCWRGRNRPLRRKNRPYRDCRRCSSQGRRQYTPLRSKRYSRCKHRRCHKERHRDEVPVNTRRSRPHSAIAGKKRCHLLARGS